MNFYSCSNFEDIQFKFKLHSCSGSNLNVQLVQPYCLTLNALNSAQFLSIFRAFRHKYWLTSASLFFLPEARHMSCVQEESEWGWKRHSVLFRAFLSKHWSSHTGEMVLLKHTHTCASACLIRVLTQNCLSLSLLLFSIFCVFIPSHWCIFNMICLLLFSNAILRSCVYPNVSFPYPQAPLIPSVLFLFPLPRVNKHTTQDEAHWFGQMFLLKRLNSEPTFSLYGIGSCTPGSAS